MAKRFRKQISRALKRRFQQYEKEIQDFTSHCIASSTCTSHELLDSARLSFSYSFKQFSKRLLIVFAVFAAFCGVCVLLSSCNVTRRVTTESSYYTKGDTAITITTRTVESYDATKKVN